jgi:hypothetical protein
VLVHKRLFLCGGRGTVEFQMFSEDGQRLCCPCVRGKMVPPLGCQDREETGLSGTHLLFRKGHVCGFNLKVEHVCGFNLKVEHVCGFTLQVEHVCGFNLKVERVCVFNLKVEFLPLNRQSTHCS